jgi:adenosylhomocysteine nucleosidase
MTTNPFSFARNFAPQVSWSGQVGMQSAATLACMSSLYCTHMPRLRLKFPVALIQMWRRMLLASGLFTLSLAATAAPVNKRCLIDCASRIGIVSAFGAEADILIEETRNKRVYRVNGNRYTTGVLRGNPVVIALSGVSMINSAMVTQSMLDHFRIERLIMSGIAGGVNPANHVGDVTVPDRWAMPLEVFWNTNSKLPSPCGKEADISCLGLQIATGKEGRALPPFVMDTPLGKVETGLFMRKNYLLSANNAPQGEFVFDYPVDETMLAVARSLKPELARCGPKARRADATIDEKQCVRQQPRLLVGGRGVSATVFLANAQYRAYLHEVLEAQTFEMETAALAHVARANGVPYIAFRSLSDLAGAEGFDEDVGALFSSGLAETNEARVTLAFLEAWKLRGASKAIKRNKRLNP